MILHPNVPAAVGDILGFQQGGIVPGPLGAPRLAFVHGGERILRSGQAGAGGVTIQNLNVHGSVLTERDLVRTVREGLIRLNREVIDVGF